MNTQNWQIMKEFNDFLIDNNVIEYLTVFLELDAYDNNTILGISLWIASHFHRLTLLESNDLQYKHFEYIKGFFNSIKESVDNDIHTEDDQKLVEQIMIEIITGREEYNEIQKIKEIKDKYLSWIKSTRKIL